MTTRTVPVDAVGHADRPHEMSPQRLARLTGALYTAGADQPTAKYRPWENSRRVDEHGHGQVRHRAATEHPAAPAADAHPPLHHAGVTCAELACGPHLARGAEELVDNWGRDRALPSPTVHRLSTLVVAAVSHGQRFQPRGVNVTMGWQDPDRIRVVVKWHGCAETAVKTADTDQLARTEAVLDTFADGWGFGGSTSEPVQWFVLDTLRCPTSLGISRVTWRH